MAPNGCLSWNDSIGNDGGNECFNEKMRRLATIQQSTGKQTQCDSELRNVLGGFRRGLRNQTSIDPTVTMQSKSDPKILMLGEMEKNTAIANRKNGKSASKANSKFAVSVPAKPNPKKSSEIILDSSDIDDTLSNNNYYTHCLPSK